MCERDLNDDQGKPSEMLKCIEDTNISIKMHLEFITFFL